MHENPAGSPAPELDALSAASAVAAGRDFIELTVGARGVYWIEFDPASAQSRIWRAADGALACVSPAGFSARSRVYEYGGGAFCVGKEAGSKAGSDVIAFVNESDQRVYRFAPDDDGEERDASPRALSAAGLRYGDLRYAHGRVLAVEQDGDTHRLVALDAKDGTRDVLAEGADFYAAPVFDDDGSQLAWIEWQHPHQPWSATRLMLRTRAADGAWSEPRTIAGAADDESIQQPCFDKHGRLCCLTDRAGYWQPWRLDGDKLVPIDDASTIAADHASAPWQLGARNWLPLDDGGSAAAWFDNGWGALGLRDAHGTLMHVATQYSLFHHLAADATHLYCLAASPECAAAVLAIGRRDGRVSTLTEVANTLPAERIARPQVVSVQRGDAQVRGFFYAPLAADDHAGPPPLIVAAHGGPTSASYPVFASRVQYWVERGFAYLLLNYRGSTGYGRAYRQALHLEWGVADVDDACAAVAWLADEGLADGARAFIRGGSAGGYTTLCALAFRDVFRGGASLYGVSDPLSLDAHTHKFEARYLRWLIGDPAADLERYRARTPLFHAASIRAPVIFFQGELDEVVTPDQTRSMAAALDANGVPVEVHYYADERHGFRKAANQAHALDAEHAFYRRILDGLAD